MIHLNTDAEHVREVNNALAANDGYCPCKLEKIEDNRCMCKEFREQKNGMCHCGKYIKE